MTDDELPAFKSDLEVAYATIEAALTQSRTLLAVHKPELRVSLPRAGLGPRRARTNDTKPVASPSIGRVVL